MCMIQLITITIIFLSLLDYFLPTSVLLAKAFATRTIFLQKQPLSQGIITRGGGGRRNYLYNNCDSNTIDGMIADNKQNSETDNDSSAGSRKKLFWNRETCHKGDYSKIEIQKPANILALANPNDDDNVALYDESCLPEGAKLLAVGTCLDDFDIDSLLQQQPNVVFVSHPYCRGPLVDLIQTFPTIEWIHSRSAGVDYFTSEGLSNAKHVRLINAKGMYSSTLAEYSLMACSYFSKDLPRLLRQKKEKNWNKYDVLELRGATFGIIGYGDIGRACAKLAKAYGMSVLACRRSGNNNTEKDDPYCDEMYYGMEDGTNKVLAKSDYILIAAPLTDATRGMISHEQFQKCSETAVIINVGRGPIIDEEAMIEALRSNRIKGAALDVTTIEPLPQDSPLWELDNVLLSPHNMDKTATFQKESTAFFLEENLQRFMRNLELYNPVDKSAGY